MDPGSVLTLLPQDRLVHFVSAATVKARLMPIDLAVGIVEQRSKGYVRMGGALVLVQVPSRQRIPVRLD